MDPRSVLQLMENQPTPTCPSGAIARLKEEPGCFEQMCADDPELGELPSRTKPDMAGQRDPAAA